MLLQSLGEPQLAASLSRRGWATSGPAWEEREVVAFREPFKLQLVPLT